MKFKVLITTTLLAIMLPAAADFTTVQEAYEVALSNIRLPRTESGTIAFKECDSCDYVTVRVGVDTVYRLDGNVLPLGKFRVAVARVENRDSVPVTVLRHLERNQVTSVSVNL